LLDILLLFRDLLPFQVIEHAGTHLPEPAGKGTLSPSVCPEIADKSKEICCYHLM